MIGQIHHMTTMKCFLTSSIPIQLTYCMLFTSSVIRVSKHLESITTGSRKSPTSRLRFQFRPRLQAATLGDRSVRRCMKSNTLKDSRICASCDKLGEFFNQLIKENGTVKSRVAIMNCSSSLIFPTSNFLDPM